MKFRSLTKISISISVIFSLLILIFQMNIYAMDFKADINNAEYNLSVYVPKNIAGEISFYPCTGFDDENRDVFVKENKISYEIDSDTDGKYDIYTMDVREGMYSFRAKDKEGKSLGGGVLKVPGEEITNNKNESDYDMKVYLRLSKTYITNSYDGVKASAEDFSVTLINKFGTVTIGDAFVDDKGYTCYPALIYANGNALLYYVTATPSEEYKALYQLKEERNSNIAVSKSDKLQNFKLELQKAIPFTITAPAGAKVFMYNQIMNFNTAKIEPVKITDNGDGTYNHKFEYAGDSYRVSMEGKRTQAGYAPESISEDGTNLNVTFPDGGVNEQTDTWSGRTESGVLLNINERNKLVLEIGESYKVRAYRAPWQIINSDTDNIMIEPDFHFNILLGNDVIDIKQSDGGNAGGNWAEVTAKNNGIAIVEVSYDAIDVTWSNKTETYSATNPRRTGVFVVTVGDSHGDVSGIDIDSEYHTQYYIGNNGVLNIAPNGNDVRVDVANVWCGTLRLWKNIVGEDGKYDIPVSNGNNVLKITSDGVTDYRVIRASELETIIINKTNLERTESVCPGDELTIGFKGLFQWIPKFSGIYNPSSLYAVYRMDDNVIESRKSQYALPETTMDITVPDDAKDSVILNSGKLTGNTLGSKWSAHRQLTDIGVPANFNASDILLSDIALPDIVIPIIQKEDNKEQDNDEVVGEDEEKIPDGSGSGGELSKPDSGDADTGHLKFDISEDEAEGYVTVSFEDFGKRNPDESGITYKKALGEIIKPTQVPFKDGDTIASVTLRLLKASGIKATYTGKPTNNFYLSSIGGFNLKGKYYSSFGEFDAGVGSGWMITHNDWFIDMGASEFEVEDGDVVKWMYTCQLGADIGCDRSDINEDTQSESNHGSLSATSDKNAEENTDDILESEEIEIKTDDNEEEMSEKVYFDENTFDDVKKDAWYYDAVKYVYENNFMKGTGEGFSPDSKISRAMIVTILYRMEKSENVENNHNFTDVKPGLWYSDAVAWAASNGIISGITETEFAPDNFVTREQMATFIYRYAKMKNCDVTDFADVDNFEDADKISSWALDAIKWANKVGLIKGTSKTTISPNAVATRAQTALILMRFCENVFK